MALPDYQAAMDVNEGYCGDLLPKELKDADDKMPDIVEAEHKPGDLQMEDDHDIHTPTQHTEESSGQVQCREMLPGERVESQEGRHRIVSSLEVCSEEIDRPRHDPSLQSDSSHEIVDQQELHLKYPSDETTEKKLKEQAAESDDDEEDGFPLELRQYLKNPFQHTTHLQGVKVYMLTQPQLPTQVAEKPDSNRESSLPSNCHTEMSRLGTFAGYPTDLPIFAIRLAGNGFVYRDDWKAVECYFCGFRIPLSNLSQSGLDPAQLHRARSPNCPFVKGQNCNNIPFPTYDPTSQAAEASQRETEVFDRGRQSDAVEIEAADSRAQTASSYQANSAVVLPSPTVQQQPLHQTSRSVGAAETDSVPSIQQPQPSGTTAKRNRSQNGNGSPRQNQTAAAVTAASTAESTRNRNTNMPQPSGSSGPPRAVAANGNSSASATQNSSNRKSNGAAGNGNGSPRQNQTATAVTAASSAESTRNRNTNVPRPSGNSGPPRAAAANGNSSASTTQNSSNGKSNGAAGNGGNKVEPPKGKKKLTYSDLGIFAEKPKRDDMAVLQKRLATFNGKWKATLTQTPKMLADAGMYYAGYADCARCFFCGGGLKNWEPPDNPWIEHARWFPKCAYIRMCKGPKFVEIVQRKNKNKEDMTLQEVEAEAERDGSKADNGIDSAGAPVTVSSSVGPEAQGKTSASAGAEFSSSGDLEILEAENEELKSQMACKICMDADSSVVFLPCGHLVACAQCAIALKTCPFCRTDIKGSVCAHMIN